MAEIPQLDVKMAPEPERPIYSFAALDPRPIPAANAANDTVLQNPVGVLGIEVTVPQLAERCTLGNIDPQHSENKDQAAIEAALIANLPPNGATLATVRPDTDSIGAMAVLTLRASNTPFEENEALQGRIQQIAESDRFARGGWPGRKPLPTSENPWPDSREQQLAALQAAISDFKVPLEKRVALMQHWLQTGDEPSEYRERVEAERMDMIHALENGEIKVSTTEDGKIALVTSKHRAAMAVGYSQAPVVIAENPEFAGQDGSTYKKFTIAQFEPRYVNLKSVTEELNKREQGWGGSPTIIGSPQGISSTLSQNEVAQILHKYTR